MDARIRVVGGDGDAIAALGAWLGEERELRGAVRVVGAPIGEGQLGSLSDVIVVALGAGGAGTALASSLITWLQLRRTTAKITVEASDRSVTLEIQTLKDVRPLLEQILKSGDDA